MKKLVLFDLDGTLVTTGGAGCRALAKAAEKLYGKLPKFEHALISGRTDLDNFTLIYGMLHKGKKPSAAEIKKLQKAYVDQLPDEVHALVRAHKYNALPGVEKLLKEISKDKLVIMVTHNSEIAEQYSTRIVRLVDGEIVEDTNPFSESEEQLELNKIETDKESVKKNKKAKMSLWTAFKLSLRNLFTKRGRTMLTSFAGSIGIIGIALILAVSQGTTAYINHVQETTLSSYPITLEETTIDLTTLMESFMGVGENDVEL